MGASGRFGPRRYSGGHQQGSVRSSSFPRQEARDSWRVSSGVLLLSELEPVWSHSPELLLVFLLPHELFCSVPMACGLLFLPKERPSPPVCENPMALSSAWPWAFRPLHAFQTTLTDTTSQQVSSASWPRRKWGVPGKKTKEGFPVSPRVGLIINLCLHTETLTLLKQDIFSLVLFIPQMQNLCNNFYSPCIKLGWDERAEFLPTKYSNCFLQLSVGRLVTTIRNENIEQAGSTQEAPIIPLNFI